MTSNHFKKDLIDKTRKMLEHVTENMDRISTPDIQTLVEELQTHQIEIESHLHEHSDVQFTHGICQECIKKHYPDYKDHESG